MSERTKVSIESDGTAVGTHILVDGKPIDATYLRIEIAATGEARCEVHLYVDSIKYNGDADLIESKKETAS